MTMTNADQLVLVSVKSGTAFVRFNRPGALNAINVDLARQWRDAVVEVGARDDVRVIVLSGEGRAFMAGGDLRAFHADPDKGADTARALIEPLNEGLIALANGDAPVIASVQGAVAGAGMSIALGADLCIAADDTTFDMAYARIGASPDAGGSWYLPRLVGLRQAMSIALLSDRLSAARALQLNLVNRVVPAQRLASETEALAAQLARGPTAAYGRIRRLLRGSLQHSLEQQLALECEAFAKGAETGAFREGIDAFVNKRAPDYQPKGLRKETT